MAARHNSSSPPAAGWGRCHGNRSRRTVIIDAVIEFELASDATYRFVAGMESGPHISSSRGHFVGTARAKTLSLRELRPDRSAKTVNKKNLQTVDAIHRDGPTVSLVTAPSTRRQGDRTTRWNVRRHAIDIEGEVEGRRRGAALDRVVANDAIEVESSGRFNRSYVTGSRQRRVFRSWHVPNELI